MNLLIVESPNKISKIKALLGAGWEVAASVGHIRDLPKKGLGIDTENGYKLLYEISEGKQNVVSNLRNLVSRHGKQNVYLATDPDREGEAISFHLCQALGLDYKTTHRVTFQEITSAAVLTAVGQPRRLDIQLVSAQEARRAVDRLVGYKISPVLWKKLESGLSAGRVQSVAVRLAVEREREIMGFADRFTFLVHGTFLTPAGEKLRAKRLTSLSEAAGAQAYLRQTIGQTYSVQNVTKEPVERKPPPAYSTSSLQQDGVRKLKLSVKGVMDLAQRLFEAGHITYMRTDSVVLSDTAIAEAKHQILQQFGAAFFQERKFKNKAGAQEAHEAIRPTHWENPSAGSSPDEIALYQLIYQRALASQMAAARFDQTTVTVASALPEDTYAAVTRVLTFEGYLKAYQEAEEEPEEDEENGGMLRVPLQVGDQLGVELLEAKQTFAKPPKRYDEATLVADLEKKQIGRPSTYASILATILKREYVKPGSVPGRTVPANHYTLIGGQLTSRILTVTLGADKNKLLPTPTGTSLIEFLEANFTSVVDYAFTAKCEEIFDTIAAGTSTYRAFVPDFDSQLTSWLAQAETLYKDVAGPDQSALGTYEEMPIFCGKGKFGTFVKHNEQYYNIKDVAPSKVTLELAIKAIEEKRANALREVGTHAGKPVYVGKGKFGTYVKWESSYFDAPKDLEPHQLTDAAALRILQDGLANPAKPKSAGAGVVATVGKYTIKEGQYGFYVTDGQTNASLPKGTTREVAAAMKAKDCQDTIKNYKEWQKNRPKK